MQHPKAEPKTALFRGGGRLGVETWMEGVEVKTNDSFRKVE